MQKLLKVDLNIKIKNEPTEVTEIRHKILEEFKDLVFVEDGHKYFLNGETLPSVTTITHKFCQYPFDTDVRAEVYAAEHGETAEYWKDKWKFTNLMATTSGSLVHEYGESLGWLRNGHPELITESCKYKYVEDKGWLIPTRPKEEAILKFYDELHPSLHFVLAEAKVYSNKSEESTVSTPFCGTFDLLMYYKDPVDDNNSGLVLMDYKGLPLDTPIATIDGWKTMGTINEGDFVFDKNGKPTKVLHVSEIHHNPCYKIKFDNGEEIVADCDHRWEISFSKRKMENGAVHTVFENKVMTTDEISNYLSTVNKRVGCNIPKIFINKPIECEKKELPIDPYVFGCWLGDGNKADGKITNMYDELWEEIEKRGYKVGKDVSQGGAGKAQTRTVFGLTTALRKLGCLKNKHIPDIFMFSSYEQRLDILRGLMDTDGYYNKTRKRFVISTTQEWQADCACRLLASLGIKATKIKAKGKCTKCKHLKDGVFDKFDVNFASDVNPFLIRKVDFKTPTTRSRLFRNIISVEKTDMVETKCIEVESETHTFCCGYNMLVTHNTNKELYKEYSHNNNRLLLPPFNDLYEEPLSYYKLQLNLYSLCLKGIGLKVKGCRVIWLKNDGTYELIPIEIIYDKSWFKNAW